MIILAARLHYDLFIAVVTEGHFHEELRAQGHVAGHWDETTVILRASVRTVIIRIDLEHQQSLALFGVDLKLSFVMTSAL